MKIFLAGQSGSSCYIALQRAIKGKLMTTTPVAEVQRIAHAMDSTLLRVDATAKDIESLCHEAIKQKFFAVCVRPQFIDTAQVALAGSPVRIVTVIGFPEGSQSTGQKCKETIAAIEQGAHEIDMVLNLDLFLVAKGEALIAVRDDIEQVRKVIPAGGHVLKVIIETGILSDQQKVSAAKIVEDAGAHFVKTCTGFRPGVATIEDVKLLRANLSPRTRIKASGGIKESQRALALLDAGADRIGSSSAVEIVRGLSVGEGGY